MRKTIIAIICILFFFLLPADPAAAKETVIVVIDPGHGGENLGGETDPYSDPICEKDIDLLTAMTMAETLQKFEGIEVYLTRETDVDLTLEERAAFADEVNADFLFSIHYNASGNHWFYGTEVWTSAFGSLYTKGQDFGRIQIAQMKEAFGLYDRGVKVRLSSKGNDYYGIIRNAKTYDIPAVIIEHCHMDHIKDNFHLSSESRIRQFGYQDAISVAKYFGLNSEELDLDFRDYTYEETEYPSKGKFYPDETKPLIDTVKAVMKKGEDRVMSVSLSAHDEESRILYYSYSLDAGLTWYPCLEWDPSGSVDFEVRIPYGSPPVFMVRVINEYNLISDKMIMRP